MMNKKIKGQAFMLAVCKALNIDPSTVRRVVIDARVDSMLMVYTEHFGTEKLLEIDLEDLMKDVDIGDESRRRQD